MRHFGFYAAHSEQRCRELLRMEIQKTQTALAEVREILTQSEMQCHHPTDDGELCDGEDCIYCAMLHSIDAALPASEETSA